MTLLSKLQIGALTVAVLLIGWQFQQHRRQSRELAGVEAQVQNKTEELESQRTTLAALEERSNEIVEAERRAGNGMLLSLMRERAASAKSISEAASKTHSVGNALAKVLDDPEQQEIEQEYWRNEMRAELNLFFNLLKLPPDRQAQYIDLQIDLERRKADRISALLHGKMTVADALRERDQYKLESDQRNREILGPEGCAFQEGIGDGMRNDEAKRLLKSIQQNMGSNSLNQEQSDRLQSLLKAELCTLPLDDTDLFRTPEEWAQIIADRQQNVLTGADAFLTPAQLEMLRTVAEADLAQRREQMIVRRKSLGIK
jgi:hypothetical protein